MESTAIVYIRVASGGQSTNEVIWQQYEAVCRYCEQQDTGSSMSSEMSAAGRMQIVICARRLARPKS